MPKGNSAQTLFGRRLREARLRAGIAQDRLGVMIGLDESCSSARMSRYENGIHQPPFTLIQKLSVVLGIPAAYFFCADDRLAEIIQAYASSDEHFRQEVLGFVQRHK